VVAEDVQHWRINSGGSKDTENCFKIGPRFFQALVAVNDERGLRNESLEKTSTEFIIDGNVGRH
jgi:hypothetical protein